jgi:hypothetical protein
MEDIDNEIRAIFREFKTEERIRIELCNYVKKKLQLDGTHSVLLHQIETEDGKLKLAPVKVTDKPLGELAIGQITVFLSSGIGPIPMDAVIQINRRHRKDALDNGVHKEFEPVELRCSPGDFSPRVVGIIRTI